MTNKGQSAVRLHHDDNILIAVDALDAGAALPEGQVEARQPVPAGHKVASTAIRTGENVVKYGQIIGRASCDIAPGDHVHGHNLAMSEHRQGYDFSTHARPVAAAGSDDTFLGYHRPSGRIGTRNYVGIVTSVNCSGSVARFIAEAAEREDLLAGYENVDGIVPIAHGGGCGMSASGEGFDTLRRTISGFAQNPNFGAILLVGLGCEVMQIPALVGKGALSDDKRFRYMTIQQEGGTRATIDTGLAHLRDLVAEKKR